MAKKKFKRLSSSNHAKEHQPNILAESAAEGSVEQPGVQQQGGGHNCEDTGSWNIDEDGDKLQAGVHDRDKNRQEFGVRL